MKIIYTSHLKSRLKERKFPSDYPKIIYNNPDERFFDFVKNNQVAIKKLPYGKNKNPTPIMIAYIENSFDVIIQTIHALSQKQIENNIYNQRWYPNGKKN